MMRKENIVFWLLSFCFILLCIVIILYTRLSAEKASVTIIPLTSETTVYRNVEPQLLSEEALTEKININTASKSQLVTLPGIGEKTAENILAYREEYGGFDDIEEIMNVSGIGQAKFDAIKDQITV